MTNQLEIGKNYGEIFGLEKSNGTIVYNGGINWTATQGDRIMTMDSQAQTDAAIKYINQPSVQMGVF